MDNYPPRPPTPQAMLHRLPDKPDSSSPSSTRTPSKYVILITASTAFAGKVQIAKSVATALSCPLFQGDSLHETSAKAASVGVSRRPAVDGVGDSSSGLNEARYQRMWLSKMTRTGLLFPEESRPAVSSEGFAGFGGSTSTSTSRRGSVSSIASSASDAASVASVASSFAPSNPLALTTKFVNKPVSLFTLSDEEKARKANRALMVITHPELEGWHREGIRKAVGEYGIAIIFVPLGEEEELPILKPLDPRVMMSFWAFEGKKGRSLDEEIVVSVGNGNVEELIEDIVSGVREIVND